MRILFVHQNFPAQFRHLAPALRQAGHEVRALRVQRQPQAQDWQGVRVHSATPTRGSTSGVHPWVGDFETKVIRGEAALRAALGLRAQGFTPDVIVAHPGWGEALFLKEVWPDARLGLYCEFFYGADEQAFDPEFPPAPPALEAARLRVKNANNVLHIEQAWAGLAPTHWQRHSFPLPFRDRISVAHDGIDTQRVCPDRQARFRLPDGRWLSAQDEVISFVNRNLEPYRGYHVFMRALPELLRRRPRAQVVLVGGEGVSYGAAPPAGSTWKHKYLSEVADQLDLARVHFVGNLPYASYLSLLQVASVHVYLSYPFVLSWSLLEALAAGCAVVASDTAALREVVNPGENAELVPFLDRAALVAAVAGLCADPQRRAALGQAGRLGVQTGYDLHTVCLPAQQRWVESLGA